MPTTRPARADGDKAQAALIAAQRQIDVIDTQKLQARGGAGAAVAEPRHRRGSTSAIPRLRAPIDGTVGNRRARHGAYADRRRAAAVDRAGARPVGRCQLQGRPAGAHDAPGQAADISADVLPGEMFHGHVDSLAPATGAQFSVLPPENATGNFTKIVQRVPVRILLDGEASRWAVLRPGLSVTAEVDYARPAPRHERRCGQPCRCSRAGRSGHAERRAERSSRSPCMCVGIFIALLDIQIVSASLRDIGGGLSAGADETAWVQTSYLIAEIMVIPLSGWLSRVMSTRWLFSASAVGFTLTSLLCGWPGTSRA